MWQFVELPELPLCEGCEISVAQYRWILLVFLQRVRSSERQTCLPRNNTRGLGLGIGARHILEFQSYLGTA